MKYYTPEESGEIIQVPASTIKGWIQRNTPGGQLFIKKEVKVRRKNNFKTYWRQEYWYMIAEEKITELRQYAAVVPRRGRSKYKSGWTESSIQCYLAGCVCSKCENNEICTHIEKSLHTRPIKNKVLELVRELGVPYIA